jgi:phage recombination protein Bet
MNAITKTDNLMPALQMNEGELLGVLQSSLYPGAALESIKMVLGYCKASGLDPMQKPVHIVPMWDSKAGSMRDVVMPGIGMYRTQAARSGVYAGITEPEYGPDVTEKIGGVEITYPQWCKVTVKRKMNDGMVADFTAIERWRENYAIKGGKEKSVAPNAMWTKRPYAQLAKCAQAQALRMAFPEIGAQPTADEMEGRALDAEFIDASTGEITKPSVAMPKSKSAGSAPSVPSTPSAPAAAPSNMPDRLATDGERAHITKKFEAAGLDLQDALDQLGIPDFEQLSASQFGQLRDYVAGK